MPMQQDLYPADWQEIATAAKEAANWTCQQCGIKHGELRANRHGKQVPVVLTVAHLDHNPWARRARLRVLCGRCHCRYDAAQRRLQRRMMAIARGQLVLPGLRREFGAPPVRERGP